MIVYWLGYIVLAVGVVLFLSLLLRFLWNITMPEVFNLKPINFWQAFRLLLIAFMLFGGPILISSANSY